MKISPQTWKKIEPLLTVALDMGAAERTAWLVGLHASHPEEAPLVARMLATHDRAELAQELETVPRLAPAPQQASAFSAGDRIGPFRLVRPIGRGGMGEVWLAEQADGRVTRQVALKLPALHLQRGAWEERFRRERDILAKLAHPNIARLYDAGVHDSGQPWLAMEFVEGESIAEYVEAHEVPAAARLALFRQVLAAVSHAHRHLVVHRDLKPANILVDGTGQVKLLDFGIAKLLGESDAAADAQDLTRLGGRVMTLRYAAPEQVSYGGITTTTDIYALGVILHEMVTGLSPYRAAREGRPLTESMLLADVTTVPSSLAPATVARSVRGDLDAIILKAMRRDPAARYASTELFDEDIGHHLDRRPVKARAGTWRYLAGRFAVRHRLPIAMASAVIATMAVGLVVAERERRVAVTEKARAERHFDSVRKLANTFIFDVHAEIENLAGSLKARQILVGTALRYLDSLAAESRNDPALALEIAVAYRKLAEIHGDARNAFLGEPTAARSYAGRAAVLLESIAARDPDNLRALREHRVLALLLGRLRIEAGDASGADETHKAAGIADRIVHLPGAEISDRLDLGATLAEYGGILAVVRGDHAGAAARLDRAIEVLEALRREAPAYLPAGASLAYAFERRATAIEVEGKASELPRAIALLERSIATTEGVIAADPNNVSPRQTLVKRYNNAARMMLKAGELNRARGNAAKARALVEQLLAADPRNAGNASMRAGVLAMASDVEYQDGKFSKAAGLAREALAADAALPADIRTGLIVRDNAAGAMTILAASNCALAGAASLPPSRRLELLKEAHALFLASRAFKQELVDRRIDAQDAAKAIAALDARMQRCNSLSARLVRR
ncbi:MAG: serine/threonine protein kinase [Betaproteobacteria bacterium]|nr:serine/threonine protein kinase [Betaproteobacteria bacterium]